MELSEWIERFFEAYRFQIQAEQAETLFSPVEPASLVVSWPDGSTFDTKKPFWIEETGKTYETLDQAVDAMGGQMPSYASFGVVRFDR